MPTLLDILWNSFASNIVFSMRSEQLLYAMGAFGGYALALPFIVSLLGSTVGQFVHYLLGSYLAILWEKYDWWLKEEQYRLLQQYAARYGVWLLLVFMFPLYAIIPLLAGFFRLNPGKVMGLILVAQVMEKIYTMHQIVTLVQQ